MVLDGDNLEDGQLHHQHLGLTPDQAALLHVPVGPFQIQARHKAPWETHTHTHTLNTKAYSPYGAIRERPSSESVLVSRSESLCDGVSNRHQ